MNTAAYTTHLSYRRPPATQSRTTPIISVMDMDPSDNSSVTMMGMMTPWLHFTGGDNLFFKSLAPNSKGAIAGAALVLFFVAIFGRFLAANRIACELEWRERCVILQGQSQRTV